MSRRLTASDRSALIRLASSLTTGSPERRAILAGLGKEARFPPRSENYNQVNRVDGFWSWPIFAAERATGLRFRSLPQNLGNMIFFLNTAVDAWEKKLRDDASDLDASTASDSTLSVGSDGRRDILAGLNRVSGTPDGSALVADFLAKAAAHAYGSNAVYPHLPRNRNGQFHIHVGGTNPIWDVSFTVDAKQGWISGGTLTEDFGKVPFDLWTATVPSTADLLRELFSR